MIKTRLIQLLSHAKKYIVFQVIWKWLSLLCQIAMIFTVSTLLESALFGTMTGNHVLLGGITVFVAVVLRFFCDKQAVYASYQASVDVKSTLRKKIYEKLLKLGASYRESVATSEVVQMAAEGVEQLETYFGRYLSQLFYSVLAPLTLFVILSFVNVKASIVLLVCVPLIPVSIVAVQKFAKKLLHKYWGIYTELGDSFLENLQGLTTLKIYQADEEKAARMDEESRKFRQITMKVLTMQLNSTSVMDIIAYGGAAVGMMVTISEFIKGNAGLGGALTIILLASEFFIPLRLLGSFFHIAMNGMAASDKIFALLDLPESKEKGMVLENGEMAIRLKEIQFAYEENRDVLKKVSMDFPAGSFTSLVGTSGCGKSTIAGILMGRNKEYKGSITIQGKELRDISEKSLIDHITLVSHNSYLFKGTVEDNLRMGNPDASEQEMWDALKKVNLFGFLQTQQGLNTAVAEKGSNLSGGQCQRLALARALLHDTPVYIFDEATSNIDMESEEMIMLFLMLWNFQKGNVSYDSVLIATIAMMGSFGPVVALSNLSNNLNQTLASGERVLSLLEEEPLISEIEGKESTVFGGAAAEKVDFAYEEEQILKQYSVEIPKGQIVGIHGASGSGKSTLLKLFMRFWDVNSGKVLISGKDVKDMNTADLRDMESYMTQETYLFHDSIAQNIAVGKQGASREEIMEAAKKASVHDFIMTLPKGYDTKVGELGDTLSGGEKQRIGIARAFLHDAPFLLLDEPTSNLDALNEGIILKSLKESRSDKTVVLVSHRKSTMNLADVVYVMENEKKFSIR